MQMRAFMAPIVVAVVMIGLIWSLAVLLKLVPVFDSGAITRAAE
jgi:hypothetical protein